MPVLQKQLLIIMDDVQTNQLIRERLESAAMKVDCVSSLSKALEFSMRRIYCLLIIDLQISHIDNAEMVRIFRIAKRTPILAFTEALTAGEKTNLLHAGVDAFLEKPVDVELCIAQANALIDLYLEYDDVVEQSVPIAFGTSLVITPRYRQVLAKGIAVELTRIEFDLLYFMAKHPGQVFSRRELYDHVWNDYYDLGGDERVKSHIKSLSKKFAMLERDIIETVWAVGYRFIPPE